MGSCLFNITMYAAYSGPLNTADRAGWPRVHPAGRPCCPIARDTLAPDVGGSCGKKRGVGEAEGGREIEGRGARERRRSVASPASLLKAVTPQFLAPSASGLVQEALQGLGWPVPIARVPSARTPSAPTAECPRLPWWVNTPRPGGEESGCAAGEEEEKKRR